MPAGQVIAPELGKKLEHADLADAGSAMRVVVDKDKTTIVGGKGDNSRIDARLEQLQHQIEDTTSGYDREKLEERVAKLSGGVAVIKAGASTETEMKAGTGSERPRQLSRRSKACGVDAGRRA